MNQDRCAISNTGTGFAGAKLSEILPSARVARFVRMTQKDAFACRSRSLSFVGDLGYLLRYKSFSLARIEMDFSLTPKTEQLRKRVSDFMDQYVFPIEKEVQKAMGESGNTEPQSLKDVRKKAKAEGLWNLFLPDEKFGAGLKNYEYAPLCELMGRSSIGARAFNCMAPDTGNMEILAEFGTPDQKKQWLQKCIDGEIRTCFSMTEPDTPGSD